VPAAARISADGSRHRVQQYRSWPSTAPQSAMGWPRRRLLSGHVVGYPSAR